MEKDHGPRAVDGIKVYFYKTGAQARCLPKIRHIMIMKRCLVTNKLCHLQDDTYIDENSSRSKKALVIMVSMSALQ